MSRIHPTGSAGGDCPEFPWGFVIPLPVRGDARGSLVVLQEGEGVPFGVRRVYYVFGTEPGVRRGQHAHHSCRQLAVCVAGSCRFLLDDGANRAHVDLSASAAHGLLLEPMVWHEMFDFSPGCVLVVLASDLYDEGDYIRRYEDFRALALLRSTPSD